MKNLFLAVLAVGLLAVPSYAGTSCDCVTRTTDRGKVVTRCPKEGGHEGVSDRGSPVGGNGGGQGTRSSDRNS